MIELFLQINDKIKKSSKGTIKSLVYGRKESDGMFH